MTTHSSLTQAVESFCGFIESLPPETLAPVAWGPKEVLAHLLYWQELYLEQARGVLDGRSFSIPKGTYSELNARAAEGCKDLSPVEMVARLRTATQGLFALAAEQDPHQVMIPLKHGSRPYSLGELLEGVGGHFRDHQRQLERAQQAMPLARNAPAADTGSVARPAAPLAPVPGFSHFTTHHCITGSLRHIYAFHGYPVSEDMLLGLGSGVGFVYWHTRGALPFLGGRANMERPGVEGLEKTLAHRTGITVESFRTGSAAKAERTLLEQLCAGQPVMVMVDMGFLPYFDFGGQPYHFGGHAVVVCGYDPQARMALVADRDESLHPVPLQALAQARGSTFQPFPPQHTWYRFDFRTARPIDPAGCLQAIGECAAGMLHPPITNLGVKGIRKAAQRVRQWPQAIGDEAMLRGACISAGIMIDARGGTGGGLFRAMYGRFLDEVAGLVGGGLGSRLGESARRMQALAARWDALAALFDQAYTAPDPGVLLNEISARLPGIADEEQAAWTGLEELCLACKTSSIGS